MDTPFLIFFLQLLHEVAGEEGLFAIALMLFTCFAFTR